MIELGRICMKTSGRDAGKIVVVVDKVDENFVIIDGNVKRKRCNITHLEPLQGKLDIKKGADTSEVLSEMKKAKLEIVKKEKVKRTKKGIKNAAKKPSK